LIRIVGGASLVKRADASYTVTRRGAAWFQELDVDTAELRALRRNFALRCLDLTERNRTSQEPSGAALAETAKRRGFVRPRPGSRALRVTDTGRAFFSDLGLDT
jgi:hypothetical protein